MDLGMGRLYTARPGTLQPALSVHDGKIGDNWPDQWTYRCNLPISLPQGLGVEVLRVNYPPAGSDFVPIRTMFGWQSIDNSKRAIVFDAEYVKPGWWRMSLPEVLLAPGVTEMGGRMPWVLWHASLPGEVRS